MLTYPADMLMHLTSWCIRNKIAIQTLQGFFVPYLTGAIVLVVLAIGSTAPGLLQFIIGRFAQVFPDYRERVLRHEAAHFLVRHMPHPTHHTCAAS